MKEQLRSFLEFLRLNRNASPHTVAAYDSDLSQFLAFTAAQHRKKSSELAAGGHRSRRRSARSWRTCYRQGQARASVSRKLSALRTFTRYMRREGWIEGDPVALAAAPKKEQKVPAHLSIDEMSTLLATPDASEPLGCRDRAILELFYASGLRLSELVGLDVEDVNLSARMVRVMGKGAKERIVPFNDTTKKAIARLAEGARGTVNSQRPASELQDRRARGRAAVREFSRVPADRPQRAAARGALLSACAARASGSARTRCGIPSPRICSSAAPTCAPFRSCSATWRCRRRSGIRT